MEHDRAAQSAEQVRRLQRIVLQRFESLQRSGITHVRRARGYVGGYVAGPGSGDPGYVAGPGSGDPGCVAGPGSGDPGCGSGSKVLPARVGDDVTDAAVAPTETVRHAVSDLDSTDTREDEGNELNRQKKTSMADTQGPALAVIQREVAACQRCEHLACTRTQTVFGVGNVPTKLCFLGEAPGADEDRLGEPFVGRAGQLLTDIIQNGMGLQRSDVYILNVLKCRPPENRKPTDEEIANCRGFFERQLEILQPQFICCLGATAALALLNTTQSIGKLRGKWFDYGSARVLVTYHPSYLLRMPSAKKDTWEDIQMLMREMGLPIRAGTNRSTR